MKTGDRVVLNCAPWPGVIEKVRRDGRLDVALDDGGKAFGMSRDDLTSEAEPDDHDEEECARQDKAWPPKTMETKIPRSPGVG